MDIETKGYKNTKGRRCGIQEMQSRRVY